MKMTIRTGTRVMARMEEKATERVLVHARGRNILPPCAPRKKKGKNKRRIRRKTGKNETRITRSEKKIAGPTCFAAPIRIAFLSLSDISVPAWAADALRSDKWR